VTNMCFFCLFSGRMPAILEGLRVGVRRIFVHHFADVGKVASGLRPRTEQASIFGNYKEFDTTTLLLFYKNSINVKLVELC